MAERNPTGSRQAVFATGYSRNDDWTFLMLEQSGFVDARPVPPRHIGRNITDKGYVARLATDAATKREAYALRYRSYYSQGHIEANESGLLFDKYDDLPTTKTVVIYSHGEAVASVRTCALRRGPGTMSPSRAAYSQEVGTLLEDCGPERAGFDGIEVNRMVRAPEAADDQGLVFMMLRIGGYLGLTVNFRVGFICVRSHHVPFYNRLKFTQAGPAKIYPGLTCPMVLLKISRPDYDVMRQGFKLLDPDAGEPGMLRGLENGALVQPQLVRRN
jgi:hypothetical protein